MQSSENYLCIAIVHPTVADRKMWQYIYIYFKDGSSVAPGVAISEDRSSHEREGSSSESNHDVSPGQSMPFFFQHRSCICMVCLETCLLGNVILSLYILNKSFYWYVVNWGRLCVPKTTTALSIWPEDNKTLHVVILESWNCMMDIFFIWTNKAFRRRKSEQNCVELKLLIYVLYFVFFVAFICIWLLP